MELGSDSTPGEIPYAVGVILKPKKKNSVGLEIVEYFHFRMG